MEARVDISTEISLHFTATAAMTCLETTEYAALERIGIPVYRFVKVGLLSRLLWSVKFDHISRFSI